MVTYGTTTIPSEQITVLEGGTVSVSAAFDNSIGLIGGMDTANGTATEGEAVTVTSISDASDKFGVDSELYTAVELAFQNGAATVYALPVTETETTESFTSTTSGTLGTVPVMDPNVHPDEDITAQDTVAAASVEVNIVYETSVSQPSTSNTMNVNPVTGDWAADASSDYDVTYTHGDYSASAAGPLLDKEPRIVTALTENTSVVNNLVADINSRATDFTFMHLVAGAMPEIADVSTYTNGVDERRVTRAYPSRGYRDAAETDEARTVAAIGGYLASLELGISATNDSLGGFQSVRGELTGPSEAGTLRDEKIMPLLDYPPLTIVIDMTTSSAAKFERVYAMQIIDEATELSHEISRQYVGEQNTDTARNNLERSHRNAYLGMRRGSPVMLDDFIVTVYEDASDPKVTNVDIGLNVVDVMDTVDVTISVGDIIRNGGVQ